MFVDFQGLSSEPPTPASLDNAGVDTNPGTEANQIGTRAGDGWEIRSTRPPGARAPSLGGLSPAREERGQKSALRDRLHGERGQSQCDRESNVIILGTKRRRTTKRGMRFVHPYR